MHSFEGILNPSERTFPADSSFVAFPLENIEGSIVQHFERQAAIHAHRPAVLAAGGSVSYEELNCRANRIAHAILNYCQDQPVGSVALLLEHGLPAIEGIMGILKAGLPYLPLDPSFPDARNAILLEESQAPLLVTNHRNIEHAQSLPSTDFRERSFINLDEAVLGASEKNPGIKVTPDSLACILYTSGSTGTPKGVMQIHRNILHDIWQYTNCLGLSPRDRMTLFYSSSVNGSLRGMFGALLNGACLLPVNLREVTFERVAELLEQEGITFYHSVPTVFRNFARSLTGRENFPSLRVIRLGGERVLASDVELYMRHFPNECVLYTGMGSTETGHLRHCCIDKETPVNWQVVPTGYAVEDKHILILDDRGEEVENGQTGEIVVSSRYLSPGYWRCPELTESAFRPSPHANGEQLFFTGDLGRLSVDGCLEHLGRKDFQVKVRGFRVEPSEVEATLLTLAEIREAVVISTEQENASLVAYLVLKDSQNLGTAVATIRRVLEKRLPTHLVPEDFVLLDSLPQTPNGKVDRLALIKMGSEKPAVQPEVEYHPPQTEVEETVAEIWQHILAVDRVGIHDSFFHMGGHSLLATRSVSQIREVFHVDVPLDLFFRNPTVAALARFIQDRNPVDEIPSIQRVPREHKGEPIDFPLSFNQEYVWFLHQLDPLIRAYHVQASLHFEGALHIPVLERCLNEIVRRHEIFRTTFPTIDGQPRQRIHNFRPISLNRISLEGETAEAQEAAIQKFINEQESFDLTRLPLVRWTLATLSKDKHVLIHVANHLLQDGWTFNQLLRELLALYQAFLEGHSSPLPEPRLQNVDFAVWQRERMQSNQSRKQLDYWKQKLGGNVPVLQLPFKGPRPKMVQYQGTAHRFDLEASLCNSLRTLARQEGVTVFMTMLAAFFTLLYRYTREEDLTIGSGIANRQRRESEGIMGMIINMVALRVDMKGNPTFRQLLKKVRRTTLEAYMNQDVPFGDVVKALAPKRDLSYAPLYQVSFTFQDAPLPKLELPGLKINLEEVLNNESAKFDLNVAIISRTEQLAGERGAKRQGGMTVSWEYNTHLFEASTIASMEEHFRDLLAAIARNPEERLSDLQMIATAEQKQLFEWSAGIPQSAGAVGCIDAHFTAQLRRSPDSVAVRTEDTAISYRLLNEQANKLAHLLRQRGLKENDPVALFMDRSENFLVGALGVLKAGGAYVPIDPGEPASRNQNKLSDSGAAWLVFEGHSLPEKLPSSLKTIDLKEDAEILQQQPVEDPRPIHGPDSLAYIIYTSGSTGIPKGVAVPHRAVVHLVTNTDYIFLDPSDRVAFASNVSFDAATFEIWGALLNGAELSIIHRDTVVSPRQFAAELSRQRITTLFLTTTLFNLMAEQSPEVFGSLKHLLFGGETATPRWVRRVLMHAPPERLIQVYGPTENTTFTTWHQVEQVEENARCVPIGRPIAGTRVHILDSDHQPSPIGVAGELYIGGDGLAVGYHNRPDLNVRHFIADPFQDDSKNRLYRSGDIGRWRIDGVIEFLGRVDDQVKIRGFRVEPGEVDYVLAEHPTVSQALVVARTDSGQETRLVGYVVADNGHSLDTSDLRGFLNERLPDYMIPTDFVELRELPLGPTGKVDRQALPETENRVASKDAQPMPAPCSELEHQLVTIWESVLNVRPIRVMDNFFALGGHSLVAFRLASKIGDLLGYPVPVRSVFDFPTIRDLATLFESGEEKPGPSSSKPVKAKNV